MIMRIVVPASMLVLTHWKIFLYFVLPFSLLMQRVMISQTERVYQGTVNCDSMMENFNASSHISRDSCIILFISYGIFSHCKTLVSRFIVFEKSIIQQKQLTQVFNEQSDGLVVLK